VTYLKEILFNINKEEKDGHLRLNTKKLLVTLKAKELTMFKRNIKTYSDIIFAPIEK
jgi:hypothetical protein